MPYALNFDKVPFKGFLVLNGLKILSNAWVKVFRSINLLNSGF